VSGNIKYKGHFGDPFQNTSKDYAISREKAQEHTLNKTMQEFVEGYSNYLGDKFLKEYGDYSTNSKAYKMTTAFKYFEYLGSYMTDTNGNSGIKGFFKKLFFKLRFG